MKHFAIVALLFIVGLSAQPQTPPPRLTAVLASGDVIEGRLRSATETDVTLDVAGQALTLPLVNVRYLSFVGVIGSSSTAATILPAVPTSTPRPVTAPAGTKPATRTQCAATTQKGTRCSRMASVGSAYCWQHGG